MGNTTHGGTGTHLYTKWASMRARCNNPNTPNWHRYGERGIGVCDEWSDFATFRDWAQSHGYTEQADSVPLAERWSIDRIDNDGDYEPGNCRWITFSQNVARQRQWVDPEIASPGLTWADVDEIRALWAAGGESYRGLADRFGVFGEATIYCIVAGRTWNPRNRP